MQTARLLHDIRRSMTPLVQLTDDIDARVQAIREGAPDWLCNKGCDYCCRHLANVPELTAAEWALLSEGLAALEPRRLKGIIGAVGALGLTQGCPVVCPMLDRESGACPVYAHRPVACRTYGFYVQRDKGLYCGEIEARVAFGGLDEVVWGNQDAVDHRLGSMGESRPLTVWFARWLEDVDQSSRGLV